LVAAAGESSTAVALNELASMVVTSQGNADEASISTKKKPERRVQTVS
jgi:hypothetical protein